MGELRRRGYIEEGINDPHILKAIFTAGGSGSGKTYVSSHMVKGLGLKVVNSDDPLERYLKKADLPLVMQVNDPDTYAKQLKLRDKAKLKIKASQATWEKGLLGLLIDGTGRNADKILSAKRSLEELGYDTAMVYIDAPLQTAIDSDAQRGKKGGRTVGVDVVTSVWKSARANMHVFANAFGKNFFHISRDRTGYLAGDAERVYGQQLRRVGLKWLSKPVENPIGKAIIARLRDTGGKTRDDLPPNFTVSAGQEECVLRQRGYSVED